MASAITITRIGDEVIPRPHPAKPARQWVRCKHCGWVGYYDYLPYSLSNPIMVLGCNHDWRDSEAISVERAVSELNKQRKSNG